jgi:uncharacterized membrane protein
MVDISGIVSPRKEMMMKQYDKYIVTTVLTFIVFGFMLAMIFVETFGKMVLAFVLAMLLLGLAIGTFVMVWKIIYILLYDDEWRI